MAYKELCDIQNISQTLKAEEFGFLRIWVDIEGRTKEFYYDTSNLEAEKKIAATRTQYGDDILTITYSPMPREQAKACVRSFDKVAAMSIESTLLSPEQRISEYLKIANKGLRHDSNANRCFSAAKKLMEKYGFVTKPYSAPQQSKPVPNVRTVVEETSYW